jgi:hypothetical protein
MLLMVTGSVLPRAAQGRTAGKQGARSGSTCC